MIYFSFQIALKLPIMPMIVPFEFSDSIDDVIRKLEQDSIVLINWYGSNYLKPNPDMWHFLLSDVWDVRDD